MAQRFDQRAAQTRGQNIGPIFVGVAVQRRIRWTKQPSDPKSLRIKTGRKPSISSWSSLMWVLLLLPFIGLLWVPFYNFQEPSLFGFPFFYWYQLAWVPISSLLIWLVYRRRTPDEAP
jgi:hypothetical protein